MEMNKFDPHTLTAVCVCSGGSRETLTPCLESLLSQLSSSEHSLKIILVDNTSQGGLEDEIGLRDDELKQLYVVREPKKGIPSARNRAIVAAKEIGADYIAFIDDDEIVPMSWFLRMMEALQINHADVVEGGVARGKTLNEAIDRAKNYQSKADLNSLSICSTAVTSNVLFHRKLTESPYNLSFDENMVFGGSDREFFMRAHLSGMKMVEAKEEMVFEFWPAMRLKKSLIIKRWYRYGVSYTYRHKKNLPFFKAHLLILGKSVQKLTTAVLKIIVMPVRLLLREKTFIKLIGEPVADIAYGLGCVGQLAGFGLRKYH